MSIDLSGRHVVVTGGTGALGTAVVAAALEAGATCHVTCQYPTLGRFPFADHPRVRAYPSLELADEDAVSALYAGLPGLWASIQVAGGFAMAPVTDVTLADFRAQLDTNLVTCFLACREGVRAIRRTGDGGRLVNVAARPAISPAGGMLAYSTAKAGVASLSQCLAAEVLGDRIFVNAVVPSIIDTPANRQAMPDADHSRWPTPADLARTILYLASPSNMTTSGALVPVYGAA